MTISKEKKIQEPLSPPLRGGREGLSEGLSEGLVRPYNDYENKGEQIERMFDSIAPAYDPLNRILSLGIDIYWRKKGIRYLKPFAPQQILDIATGTGDLAIALAQKLKPEAVLGVDISEGMMQVGRQKVKKAGLDSIISFSQKDCMALDLPDNSYDTATVAFGVRNFENTRRGLTEIWRILKPGGHIMILEFSSPEKFPVKQLYRFYSKTIIPFFGKLLSRDKAAYQYLPASIQVFPQGEEMAGLLKEAGFTNVAFKTYTFGICSMYTGEKQ